MIGPVRWAGEVGHTRLSRRTVLRTGTLLAGAVYVGGRWVPAAQADDSLIVPLSGSSDFSFILRRREDFLRLQFDFTNAQLNPATGVLERMVATRPIQMVVGFPTQALHEEAFYESDTGAGGSGIDEDQLPPYPPGQERPAQDPASSDALKLPGSLGSRMAGPSRLVFNRDVDTVPFTIEALLDWGAWTPMLSPFALPPTTRGSSSSTGAAEPNGNQTALELPWWLLISPLPAGRWAHARSLVSHLGRTELWHTGLVEPGSDPAGTSPQGPSHIRALWAVDPSFEGYHSPPAISPPEPPSLGEGADIGTEVGVPFRGPLAPRDRADIVVSSSVDGSVGRGHADYAPVPVDVDLLMLTSMGAYLDAFGAWQAGTDQQQGASGTSLESWRHRMSLGRDHYVRVVRKGYLYPFGHRASLIKVTERKFATVPISERGLPTPRRVAYLFQRYFIVVREPVKTYPAPGQPDGGWDAPFTRIRITSLTTPIIDEPNGFPGVTADPVEVFVPTVGGGIPFRFHMQGTDRAGQTHSFTAAAPFVLLDVAFDTGTNGTMDQLAQGYEAMPVEGELRASDLGGQKVYLVDPSVIPSAGKPEHGEAVLQQIAWKPVPGGHNFGDADTDQPAFYPAMAHSRITLDALEAIAGGSIGGGSGVPFRYRSSYVTNAGFTNGTSNGMVYLEQATDVAAGPTADFADNGTDRSGGSINPGFAPTNFNLLKGCGGGNPETVDTADPATNFDPAEFFGDVGKFLGNLVLSALLRKAPLDGEDAFEITSRTEGDAQVTTMRFTSLMNSFPASNPVFIAGRGKEEPAGEVDDGFTPNAMLKLEVQLVTPFGGGEASYRVFGEVTDFQIRLFGSAPFLQLVFASASFEVLPGQKPAFDIELADVFFPKDSPLKMLAEIVTAFLSDSPFFIDLQPTSVEAGLDLRLPTITLGALQIQNLGVFFSVKIPFLGDPVLVTFGIGTRDKPVAVTYMALGGGFWITLLLTADGVKAFELGVEVRASLEGSIGPFQAYATVAVGIIIAVGESPSSPDGDATLTGYFRAEAGVSLVVVSVKIKIELSLTYIPAQEKAIGKVSVLIEVEVVFFSLSYEVEYERKFGGGSDPTFGEVYPPDELEGETSSAWDAYVDLFDSIAA